MFRKLQALVDQVGTPYLLTDLRDRDLSAYKVLGIPPRNPSRRWFLLLRPGHSPLKILHRVEPEALKGVPGRELFFSTRGELAGLLSKHLRGEREVLMNYSQEIPVLSIVDAGTVDLVRKVVRVVSSADLLNQLLGVYPQQSFALQSQAATVVDRVRKDAFSLLGRGGTNLEAYHSILNGFKRAGLVTQGTPVVALGSQGANPHFETDSANSVRVTRGPVLIDLWAKFKQGNGIFFDSTWCGYAGRPSVKYLKVFNAVRAARDAGIGLLMRRFSAGRPVRGCDVDRATRAVLVKARFERFIAHRTGHSIGYDIHGAGTNLDSWETNDTREILPMSSFSIEPGLYLPGEFGVRLETTVAIDGRGKPRVVGELQEAPVQI